MKNREAIEILHGCVVSEERENGKPNGNITCDLTREVLDMAIAALEKQTAKKLRETTSTKRCPSCNKQITAKGCIHGNYRFCRWCGQALDWGDEHGAD